MVTYQTIIPPPVPKDPLATHPGPLKHGHKRGNGETRIHASWRGMRERCLNPNNKAYKHYGGKGITICSEWNDFNTFLEEMGPSWKEGLTLERKDRTKGYSFSNCKWATWKEQQNNRSNNRVLTCNGVSATLAQWSEKVGIGRCTIVSRLKSGCSVEDALFKAVKP